MIDEDLDNLDEWIRRLRVEFDIFFNGHRKKPPDDLKSRVEKLTRKLAEVNMNYSQRFRYTTLVGRYYVYRDHWRRLMQAREQGMETRGAHLPGPAPENPQAQPERTQGIQITINDPALEEGKVRQLYDWLQSMREKGRQPAPEIPYKHFAKYISSQTQGIKQKLGCSAVVFRISLEEDSFRFTARGNGS